MSEKPLKVETKKRTKRTVTLYTDDGHFECPVVQIITGKVHDKVVPILEDYEANAGEPVPEFIDKMKELEGEEREAYMHLHAAEIGKYVQRVTSALTQIKSGEGLITPHQIRVSRTYTLKMLQAILDTSKIEEPERVELIASPIDSDFWQSQDLEEARDHVSRFRRRLA